MKPTPRTDAEADRFPQPGQPPGAQWPEIVPAEFARQLERENLTFRAAQKACEDCDAPRVDRIHELERDLESCRVSETALIADLATARDALEWARMQLGKHTRPSPIDKALGLAAALPTHQNCAVENHAVVVSAMEAQAILKDCDHNWRHK